MKQISTNLYVYKDTCNVYILKTNEKAILIDFGNGDVLDELHSIGVTEITDILMTHHHRDQAQGLERAVRKEIRIWVPYVEKDLFEKVDEHWKAREIDNNYNMRQDRFSILHSIPIYQALRDYAMYTLNGIELTVVPSPGHTTGSISFITKLDGKKLAFTGDLIYAPGKVWSMSATQWSYNGGEGIAYSVLSLLDIQDRKPDLLLPSHGFMMDAPFEAIKQLVNRFSKLMKLRKQNPRLFQLRENPYEAITPHLLKNRTSMSNSYVVLSKSGKALFIDFGYDFMGGIAAGADRASRRPWLYTISRLKEQFGIKKIDVVIPTHFHDDHVAGLNVLRDVEGTEVWCPENFSSILEQPKKYNLPCLWYDHIKVDRTLPLQKAIKWEEYEFTLHEQSGHTLYSVVIDFMVDGKRVLAIGDQYQDENVNYVYHNKFRIWDYCDSANLYRTIHPDILISGHWDPVYVNEEFLDHINNQGELLKQYHEELLPLEELDLGEEGFGAAIYPYQTHIEAGETFAITIEVKNPFYDEKTVVAKLITPDGWIVENSEVCKNLPGNTSYHYSTGITVPKGLAGNKLLMAVDLKIDEYHFGQHAEALVSIINKLHES
ncbi:MBL fold metallo-hydrolase [Metabacillus halosaccharovorans]|uniref:MBL fold metallo-hydrolase n=1 Tax=Metabacillus halosaccharovorans TaxID=930124 RepID=A0ABT3DPH3_9BACI|nr:MBL fold metallo-hydrolase [Metabacillus halosaccharovorans]MCV9888963.1 MBL fold metallo-hydrolase [Metabacillus halosaccharovorans]